MRIHVIGKDIIKFHGIYWPAMLQSAGLPLPTHLYTHGFITSAGQKMSKTLGNVVDPFELVKKYGLSATRYYLLREIPPHDDGDYSDTRMAQLHTADLANELGNLVSRTCAIAAKDGITVPPFVIPGPDPGSTDPLSTINYQLSLISLWDQVKEINKSFNTFEPWAKSAEERKTFMLSVLSQLSAIGSSLTPFLPEVGERIVKVTSGKIEKIAPLFPRISI
jgi:methionyl-tRNA synthetase